MLKRRLIRCMKFILSKEMVQFILTIAVVLLLFFKFGKHFEDINLDIFIAFVYAYGSMLIARVIYVLVSRLKEDACKLTQDYSGLCKKYNRENLLKYHNCIEGQLVETTFPEICLSVRKIKDAPYDIIMDNRHARKVYQLPDEILEHYDWIINAHAESLKYNSRTVRLDDFSKNGNRITLTYSNATYWDLLMTNRAMDYEWDNGKTIREIYEPGPYINLPLKSEMTNHIGFNGLIEIPHHGILFVKRSHEVSVGKGRWATGVSAKLDVRYDYKRGEYLTVDNIYESIAASINRELKYIKLNGNDINVKPEDVKDSIFAFYRDIVEGGKPQFLFYYRVPCDNNQGMACEIKKKRKTKNMKHDRKVVAIDGDKFKFISVEELRASVIDYKGIKQPNKLFYNKMVPSMSASVVLFLRALEEKGKRLESE